MRNLLFLYHFYVIHMGTYKWVMNSIMYFINIKKVTIIPNSKLLIPNDIDFVCVQKPCVMPLNPIPFNDNSWTGLHSSDLFRNLLRQWRTFSLDVLLFLTLYPFLLLSSTRTFLSDLPSYYLLIHNNTSLLFA